MNRVVVLDTNVFVAAGFNLRSSSAKIITGIMGGKMEMVWHRLTKRETAMIVGKIPPLNWRDFEVMFEPKYEYKNDLHISVFNYISDPDDRKFAALAYATDAVVITNDDHLLSHKDKLSFQVMTPGEYLRDAVK